MKILQVWKKFQRRVTQFKVEITLSIEVEIVSDEEFQILDEALQNAMMQIAQEGKQNHLNFIE